MKRYYRPVPLTDAARPQDALRLAGGWCWFDRIEVLSRDAAPQVIAAADAPPEVLARLTAPRQPIAGVTLDQPRIMGILNVTPDSFSDGGLFAGAEAALAQAGLMVREGADILDIGGESTRPGAAPVPAAEEIARTAPVIAALRSGGCMTPVSIDTRKADVAAAALDAGADMVNDVTALAHDAALGPVAAARGAPICLMHMQGDPATMQDDPRYDDVLLDIYDFLEARIQAAEAAGLQRANILVDPGIGFGKTLQHNLSVIERISLYHALGTGLLLGVSRKRFIGTISGATEPRARMPGSVAVALWGAGQGVQVLRVHDVGETRQALSLHQAVNGTAVHG